MNNATRHFAFFLPALNGGGAERVFLHLAEGLLAEGHSVDMVMTRASGPLLTEVPPNAMIFDLNCRRNIYSLPRLMDYLRRRRPDVLISSLNTCNIVAALAGKLSRAGTRVFIRQANTLSMTLNRAESRAGRLLLMAIRLSYPLADGIIAVSNGVAQDLREFAGLPEARTKVIYNPVLIPPECTGETPGMDWFEPDCPPVILAVGKLESQKDFGTLIRAFALLQRQRPAHLLILGEGSQRKNLERIVDELGLLGRVRLPGFVRNPYAYMRRANVFVLSSAWEGLPNVLLQAMACGCPVVSTDCPSGPREILKGGELGEMVPVGDIPAMAAKIAAVLDGKADRESLIARSREFSLDRICREYVEVCR